MRLLKIVVIALVPLIISIYAVPHASTRYGQLEGFNYEMKNGAEAKVFLGIPYAAPPIGEYRFEPPRPMKPWMGMKKAKKFGPSCFPHDKRALLKHFQYSEACLYFNVMAPLRKSTDENGYPVLVFIHGGGFEFGSSTEYDYKVLCDTFVSEGVVVVTINYRLGFLGFLTTGDHALSGNAGLWDQVLAMQFISENIAAFGGDPQRITLMGHSAGAASVGALTLSPHSNYLFQQSIGLSGSIFSEFSISETTVEDSADLIEAVGCHNERSKLIRECMKQKNIPELLEGVDKIGSARPTKTGVKFHPRYDEVFFPHPLEELMKQAPHINNMIGLTNAEIAILLFYDMKVITQLTIPKSKISTFSADDLIAYIRQKTATESDYGMAAKEFQQLLIDFYVERDVPEQPTPSFYLGRLTEMMSDIIFNMPAYYEVKLKNAQNWTTYFFVEDYHHNTSGLPLQAAYHCNEFPYLFDIPNFGGKFDFNDDDRTFQRVIVDSLINFVKTGNPSSDTLKWESVNEQYPSRYLSMKPNSQVINEYKPQNVHFWTEIVPKDISSHIFTGKRYDKSTTHDHSEL